MGIYWRYKQSPDGFRKLIELLESTPESRRKKMIDAGLAEDAAYTHNALQYLLDFSDVLTLTDMEVAEVMANTPPRIAAFALKGVEKKETERFLRCSKPAVAGELKTYLEVQPTPSEINGARFKLITIVRSLEKRGLVKVKVIPVAA